MQGPRIVTSDSVSPTGRPSPIGKDLLYGRTGGEVTADAVRAAVKHPLPISPCRVWFALFILCKVEPSKDVYMARCGEHFRRADPDWQTVLTMQR